MAMDKTKDFYTLLKIMVEQKLVTLLIFMQVLFTLKTGDFNNAVKYLKDFKTDSKQIQMIAYGRLG